MKVIGVIVDLMLGLWLVWLVPCVLLAFIRRGGRIAFFLLGLAFAFTIPWLVGRQGPDSWLLVLPFYGFAVSFAALLAEIPAFVISKIRRRRAAEAGMESGH